MVKLSSPTKPIVQQLFPLPPKVQHSIIQHDFDIVAKRLSDLSVTKSTQLKQVSPCPAQDKGIRVPPDSNCEVRDCVSQKLIEPFSKGNVRNVLPVPVQGAVISPPNPYIHFEYVSYGPDTIVSGFHVGKFEAFCPPSNHFHSYICFDFWQYA